MTIIARFAVVTSPNWILQKRSSASVIFGLPCFLTAFMQLNIVEIVKFMRPKRRHLMPHCIPLFLLVCFANGPLISWNVTLFRRSQICSCGR